MPSSRQAQTGIETPHDHDVLSGRGNFVNYHTGNEHFRALVRKHKVDYVACPKPQKGKFSKLIVDEIRNRDPPGRFLKQDPKTKLWYEIGEKKALDKTRQALREGAPEIMKELKIEGNDDSSGEDENEAEPPLSVLEPTPIRDNHSTNTDANQISNNSTTVFGSLSLPNGLNSSTINTTGSSIPADPVLSKRLELMAIRPQHLTDDPALLSGNSSSNCGMLPPLPRQQQHQSQQRQQHAMNFSAASQLGPDQTAFTNSVAQLSQSLSHPALALLQQQQEQQALMNSNFLMQPPRNVIPQQQFQQNEPRDFSRQQQSAQQFRAQQQQQAHQVHTISPITPPSGLNTPNGGNVSVSASNISLPPVDDFTAKLANLQRQSQSNYNLSSNGLGSNESLHTQALSALYRDQLDPRPIDPNLWTRSVEVTLSNSAICPTNISNADTNTNNSNSNANDGVGPNGVSEFNAPDRVESAVQPKRVPVRGLKRDESESSLAAESIFERSNRRDGGDTNKSNTNRMNGSSAHLSIMSLSLGELDVLPEDTLGTGKNDVRLASFTRGNQQYTSNSSNGQYNQQQQQQHQQQQNRSNSITGLSSHSTASMFRSQQGGAMDMSVATLGDRLSEFGESLAKMSDSQANMSFSNVFDDTEAEAETNAFQ